MPKYQKTTKIPKNKRWKAQNLINKPINLKYQLGVKAYKVTKDWKFWKELTKFINFLIISVFFFTFRLKVQKAQGSESFVIYSCQRLRKLKSDQKL